MKIREVSVRLVSVPLSRIFRGGTYQIEERCTIIVHVETDEGVTGEIYSGDEKKDYLEIRDLIVGPFRDMLIGEDPFAVERLWEAMFDKTPVLGNANAAMRAIAAVDLALWDVIGKTVGLPLYKLLGGSKEEIPIIGYAYYADDETPEVIAGMVAEQGAAGYAGTKLKVGAAPVEYEIERVKAIREAVGDDFILACDANRAWTPRQAIEFANGVEDQGVAWFEEPIRWHNERDGMAEVRRNTSIPVTAGQSELSGHGCFELMKAGAVDLLNVDATIAGGITEWKRTAATAQYFDVGMVHHEEPQVSISLLCAVPHSYCAELFPDPVRDPVWHEMFTSHPRPRSGMISPPEGPGLGIDIDQEFVARYEIG